MRNLENQSNVTPPSADYPSGRIKDDSGAGDGTPVDEAVYGDVNQFLAKMARDAPFVVLNDLPDNTTNGFQLYEAFANLAIRPALANYGNFDYLSFESFTFSPTEFVNDIYADEKYIYASVTDGVTWYILRSSIDTFGFGILVSLSAEASRITTDENNLYVGINGVGVEVYNKETGAAIPGLDIAKAVDIGGLYAPYGLDRLYLANITDSEVNRFVISTGTPAGDFAGGKVDVLDIHVENEKLYLIQDLVTDMTQYDVQNGFLEDTFSLGAISPKTFTGYGNKFQIFAGSAMIPHCMETHLKVWNGTQTFSLGSSTARVRASMNFMFVLDYTANHIIRKYNQVHAGRL